MSDKELNKYRFLSGEEPGDEMLKQIMLNMARDAEQRQKKATSVYFEEMHRNAIDKRARWAERIKALKHD